MSAILTTPSEVLPSTPTGCVSAPTRFIRKRLSDGTSKTYNYQSIKRALDVTFASESDKLVFEQKLEQVRLHLGCKSNKETITKLVMNFHTNSLSSDCPPPTVPQHTTTDPPNEFIGTTGISEQHDHTDNYIGSVDTLLELTQIFSQHSRSKCDMPLRVEKITQNGHVVSLCLACMHKHSFQWSSSTRVPDAHDFTLNHRIMLGYLASGITPIQYERFCDFSKFGLLSHHFRSTRLSRYGSVVELLRKESVFRARCEEISLSPSGIMSNMSDARHHCRKNSFHSDHVTLGLRSHKVVDIQHITRDQEPCSQKHEVVGFERMYENFSRDNIHVGTHVHDRNMSINKRIREGKMARNANDRWHCTRPISGGIRKIAQGAKKNEGKTWHPQLADKGSALRNHIYWCMDHCDGKADQLRRLIDSCIPHFQNDHAHCHLESACKADDYVTIEQTVLTDPVAVKMLEDFIHSLVVYKQAQDYVYGHDTYYVESFNNVCLIYLDKRIHYQTTMYELRSNLAVLDWNEHVDRPFTSITKSAMSSKPQRPSGPQSLQEKIVKFCWKHMDIIFRFIPIGRHREPDHSRRAWATVAWKLWRFRIRYRT